jgi:hypothetical protein
MTMPKPRSRYKDETIRIVGLAIKKAGTEDPHIVALALYDVMEEMAETENWKARKPSHLFSRIEEKGIHDVKEIPIIIDLIHKQERGEGDDDAGI